MNNIWYLKYDRRGRMMKEEMEEKFNETFKGELDFIYTHITASSEIVTTDNVCNDKIYVIFPALQRIEVYTRCPEAWEDMMLDNFIAEKEKLRTEVLKAMGVVRD